MDELITQYIPTLWSQVRYRDRGESIDVTKARFYGLKKGHPYLVEKCLIHDMSADLYLIGYPNIPFNRKMFDDVPEGI